jgi:hypothetical protein
MRKRLMFPCSAVLLAFLALGSTPASACGGYYGYGYGGCGCGYGYGYGYGYYARPAYAYYYAPSVAYARPAYGYAPYYRGWGYGPRAYYGWRGAGWRRW